MIIDTHAHITDGRLDGIRDEILLNLGKDTVSHIIEVGCDRKSSEDALRLAEENERVYAVLGIHPHYAKDLTEDDLDFLRKSAKSDKAVAIGEIGLDYYYDMSDREIQKKAFLKQLELADEVKLPVVIHLRDAYGAMLPLLKENRSLINSGIVFHCYAGSKETASELSGDYDAYYSFGGIITFDKTKKDEIIRSIPSSRLLIETDCPYLTPVPYRGKTNRPEYTRYIAAKLAEVTGKTTQQIEAETTENAKRLFFKMK